MDAGTHVHAGKWGVVACRYLPLCACLYALSRLCHHTERERERALSQTTPPDLSRCCARGARWPWRSGVGENRDARTARSASFFYPVRRCTCTTRASAVQIWDFCSDSRKAHSKVHIHTQALLPDAPERKPKRGNGICNMIDYECDSSSSGRRAMRPKALRVPFRVRQPLTSGPCTGCCVSTGTGSSSGGPSSEV